MCKDTFEIIFPHTLTPNVKKKGLKVFMVFKKTEKLNLPGAKNAENKIIPNKIQRK